MGRIAPVFGIESPVTVFTFIIRKSEYLKYRSGRSDSITDTAKTAFLPFPDIFENHSAAQYAISTVTSITMMFFGSPDA